MCSVLRREVQGEVRQGGRAGPVPQVLRNMLRGVQVRAFGDVREQARVPLLQGQEELQGKAQVPLIPDPPPPPPAPIYTYRMC